MQENCRSRPKEMRFKVIHTYIQSPVRKHRVFFCAPHLWYHATRRNVELVVGRWNIVYVNCIINIPGIPSPQTSKAHQSIT